MQQQPQYRVFVTNVHPDLTPDFLRRTFKDICAEDPVRVELFRLRDETMLTAVVVFTQKDAQLSAVLLDGVVVGKKAGCPIFVIPEDSPETFQSILPQNHAKFVSSCPTSVFSTVLSPPPTPPTIVLENPSSPIPLHLPASTSASKASSPPIARPPPTSTPITTPITTPTHSTTSKPAQPIPSQLLPTTSVVNQSTTPTNAPTAKSQPPATASQTKQQPAQPIFSLDQSFIPPSLLSTLHQINNANASDSAQPLPATKQTTPRQAPTQDKELELLRNSLVLDLSTSTDQTVIKNIFGPEGNNPTNTKEKAEVVNKLITTYKPESNSKPIPIHLQPPQIPTEPSPSIPNDNTQQQSSSSAEPTKEATSTTESSTTTDGVKASEQQPVSVPSAKNIWNWATTVFHDFLQENLEDYELSRWGIFFFERTKARIPAKLSQEHQRQFLRPLIGRIDHDFYSRGQGRDQTYHLYWALFDILLCRMYGEQTVKSETETTEESASEIECKKIMTEIGKIPQLVQANIRIYHLEQSLNRSIEVPTASTVSTATSSEESTTTTSDNSIPTETSSSPSITTASANSMPVISSTPSTSAVPNNNVDQLQTPVMSFPVSPSSDNLNAPHMSYNVIDLFSDIDNMNEDEVKRAVEKELIARYFQSITDGLRQTPTAIAEFRLAVDQISAKSAANIELLRTRQSLRTQTEFSFDVSVPLNLVQEHCSNLIPLITHPTATNNNCLIM
eukprot:TRINITY_DN9940_c0_g1_i1.p1 TRINITY_DN9940_c0_g1~~TRINITY_DN9940_c0_g1_i1.p1  ORF type:complete len:731 (+),score=154.83 TRINITY_DN9940_c0_g1_i1:39-2231(+)